MQVELEIGQTEIIKQLDVIINANRGESMFVEVEFHVDFEAMTVLSFCNDEGEWMVNRFEQREDGSVELEPMPIMTFAPGSL